MSAAQLIGRGCSAEEFRRARGLEARTLDLELFNLSERTFVGFDFSNAVMARAQLDASTFIRCDFRGADLFEASALGATFQDCEFDAVHYGPDWVRPHAERAARIALAKSLPELALSTRTDRDVVGVCEECARIVLHCPELPPAPPFCVCDDADRITVLSGPAFEWVVAGGVPK